MQAQAVIVKMDQTGAGRFLFKQEGSSLVCFPEFIWMATGAGKYTHTVFKIRNNSQKKDK